ncbi:MAG: FAD-dependent monooxygenase, partial [Hydrogenophaga sp.]|nr:FAD-dependent monooxygenase [Hydrogenophaga sp.]
DVANLCWKLAAVLRGDVQGQAAQALLDSYGEERKAHVRELTSRIKGIGAVICERDPERARQRDAKLLADAGGVVKDTPRQDVIPKLEGGLLSVTPHPVVGTLFPQPRVLRDGQALLLDEVTGTGWRLALQADIPAPAECDGLTLIRVDGDLSETEGVLLDWMQRHRCAAVLVRPDHCVFGAAADAPQLDTLMNEWRARLT